MKARNNVVSRTAVLYQVLETVPAIKKYSGSGPDAFPRKPGASRELTNPALEFIKSLCHVLSLDPTVTDEASRTAHVLICSDLGCLGVTLCCKWNPTAAGLRCPIKHGLWSPGAEVARSLQGFAPGRSYVDAFFPIFFS